MGIRVYLVAGIFYAFLYLTGLLVHAALVLVHEGVGLGEDGVDVGDGAFLDGAAEGDAEAACGVCLLKALQECIGFFWPMFSAISRNSSPPMRKT